jgi:hypothetical protein
VVATSGIESMVNFISRSNSKFSSFLQLIQMDEAYRSVVIGGDFVDNFVLFAFGKPTPRTFFPEYLSGVLERLWRTLMIHSEFQDLPSNTKLQVN